MMIRYQVLKAGIPIAICNTIEEADRWYATYDADEIVEIEDDTFSYQNLEFSL
jgi:hypothetical protein